MKIVAFKDPDYSSRVGEYDLLVNPETYKVTNEQQYSNADTTIGSSAQSAKFKGSGSGLFEILMFFDGTGMISKDKVDDQIKEVKELIYQYNGDIHEPNYLRVYWGTQSLFQGRLKSWKVNYTMLDMDGSPLRAEATATLVASVSAKKKAIEERKSSSDLTHVRTVLDGDNLPLMCHRIYGDSSYYIKVAQHNNLTNFRALKPGIKISFPPVI
ncbi:CIS tube protein [Saccharicrinis sp. GN24d3]